MRSRRLVPPTVLALALVATSSARAQKPAPANYVAPSAKSVRSSLEKGNTILPSRLILVRNSSSVTIVVDTVTLGNCMNVREICHAYPVNATILPGTAVTVMTVNPHDNSEPFEFTYGTTWHAVQALRLLGRNEIAQLGPRITHLRVEPDSLVMLLGERVTMDQVRILAYGDGDGELLGQVVSYRQRIRPDVVTLSGDTLIARQPGRTALTLGLVEPAQPLTVILPIVVVPADTTR